MQILRAILLLTNCSALTKFLSNAVNTIFANPTSTKFITDGISYRAEVKHKARMQSLLEDLDKAKLVVGSFTEKANMLGDSIEDVDKTIYASEALLEFNRKKKLERITLLYAQAAAVYRVLFDELYPHLINETATIVAVTPSDKLYVDAIKRYSTFKSEFFEGKRSECIATARVFDYFISLSSGKVSSVTFEKLLKLLEHLSIKQRTEVDEALLKNYDASLDKLSSLINGSEAAVNNQTDIDTTSDQVENDDEKLVEDDELVEASNA